MFSFTMETAYQAVAGYASFRNLALAAFIITFLVVSYRRNYTVSYPRELPRLGKDEGISWRDMQKKFATDCMGVYEEAYQKYSKKDRSVLIPVFGPRPEVILPPSSVHWLCKQPDSVLSSLEAQIDQIQLNCSLGYKFAYDPWAGMLVKTDLNSALEAVCAIMNDEIGAAFDSVFGTDTEEWKEIDLFPACRMIGGRATLRFTLGDSDKGKHLCQDEQFVQSCYGVLDAMLDVAGSVAETRTIFKPLVARWASRIMPAKLKDLKDRFEPLHRERLQLVEGQPAEKDENVPRDLLQMIMQYGIKERPKEARNVEDITKRLAVSNFGTMHQTIVTLHNLFLNVIDSNPEFDTVSVLRDEVREVFGPGDDTTSKHWSKAKVSSMSRADSIARETLRVNSFIGRTVQRLVLPREGVVTPDGIRLARGTMVSVLAHQAQTDSDTFENPLKFDPFRFSRVREAAKDPSTKKPGLNHLSFSSTSYDYLPFSHGKHACPGRFLVDFELKMIMTYAIMNYDMEFPESYGGKRPPITWFAGFGIPPLDAKIRVRRRKAA